MAICSVVQLPPTNQPTNQTSPPTDQPTDRPTNQPTNQPTKPARQPTNRPSNRPVDRATNQPPPRQIKNSKVPLGPVRLVPCRDEQQAEIGQKQEFLLKQVRPREIENSTLARVDFQRQNIGMMTRRNVPWSNYVVN